MNNNSKDDKMRRFFLLTSLLFFLVLIIIAVYWKSLPYSFQLDDYRNIVDNPSIKISDLNFNSIFSATGQTTDVAANRPISFYTFAINYYFGALDPWCYRLVNVLIHAINAILVFFCLLSLFKEEKNEALSVGISFSCATLWALHPVQTNAVAYIVQRQTSLAALFYLLAFLIYILCRKNKARIYFYLLSAFFFFLGCKTKEIVYIFPASIVLYEVSFSSNVRAFLKAKPWIIFLILITGLSLFPIAYYLYGSGYAAYQFNWQQRLLTQPRVVAHYLGLLVYPHPSRLLLDYDFGISVGLLSPPTTLFALIFHFSLIFWGFFLVFRKSFLGYCILAFYLHLVIESTIIPLDMVFEHRLYLPSIFFFAFLGGVVQKAIRMDKLGVHQQKVKFAFVFACMLLAILWGSWTYQRLDVWETSTKMWTDIVNKSPKNARAYAFLGKEYYVKGNYELANKYLLNAVQLDPKDAKSVTNLALVEAQQGRYGNALSLLQKSLSMGYKHPINYLNLGVVQTELGLLDDALVSYKEALKMEPRWPNINFYIAEIYNRLGNKEQAMLHLRKELSVNPQNTMARSMLANIARGQ